MRITYQLSKKDFSEAVGQHGGAWMKISVVLGLALLLLGMAYLALNPRQFPTPIGVIAGGLALAFSGRLRTHAAFGDKRLQNKIEAVLSDEGVEIATPTATSKLSWDAFTRYAETKNLFMIYQSANTFNILPKRAFAANEEESLRRLLDEKLGVNTLAEKKKISPRVWIFLTVVAVAAILLAMSIPNILHSQ